MLKKQVPDWLNSSLWSSKSPPDDEHYLRYSSLIDAEPATEPPSPPVVSPPEDTKKSEIRVSRDENNANDHEGPSAEDIARQSQLLAELSRKVINIRELRRIALQGIPDCAGIRPTVWKLLLGYLPQDRGLWSSELTRKRSQYKTYKAELLMSPSEITRRLDKSTSCDNDEPKCQTRGLLSRSEIAHGEHPLSLGKSSIWNKFFQDAEIVEQIDRDVKRTHPDMEFFSGETAYAKFNQEALKNILMVFAKLNPGIQYVQGMNEILAPLFYVFRTDLEEDNVVHLVPWLGIYLGLDMSLSSPSSYS